MDTQFTDAKVRAIESQIDSFYADLALPGAAYQMSLWHLLTVAEDHPRLFLAARSSRPEHSEMAVLVETLVQIDQWKYSLRHAIDRVSKEMARDELQFNAPHLSDKVAEASLTLLYAGMDYSAAYRAFSLYWAGLYGCSFDDENATLTFDPLSEAGLNYGALHWLLGIEKSGMTLIVLFLSICKAPLHDQPDAIRLIVDRTVAKGRDGIGYQFDPALARALMSYIHQFPKEPRLIPDEWNFPWGGAKDVLDVFELIQIRALYHLISVHFGSIKHSVRGWGAASLVLITPIQVLQDEVSSIRSVDSHVVRSVVQALTLGHGTTSPDPALQPIVPASESRVYLPAIQLISSNYERNLLVLHNRLFRRSFDSQSHVFEQLMIGPLERVLRGKYRYVVSGFYAPGLPNEIDLIVVDTAVHAVLVIEARWMLEPGDAKEIVTRKVEVSRKITQADQRVVHIRSDVEGTLKKLGLAATEVGDPSDWSVFGTAVVEGSVGEPAISGQNIPAVPPEVFIVGIQNSPDLRSFMEILFSDTWLPEENTHFELGYSDHVFGTVTMRWPAFTLPYETAYRDHLVWSFER